VTLNAAISRYAHCVIETHAPGDESIKLVSLDTKRAESFASFAKLARVKRFRLPLLAEIVKFFRPEGGFTLTTNSEAPAGAGIGGSSAMAVSICAALDRFTGRAAARWTGFTSAATRRPSSSTSPQACRITIRRRSAARRPLN